MQRTGVVPYNVGRLAWAGITLGIVVAGGIVAGRDILAHLGNWGDDLAIYTNATASLFGGHGWYLDRQLAGPYELMQGDVLYPPVAAWAFAPWLVLPWWSFSLIPVGILVWYVRSCRVAPWAWPVIALMALWPRTVMYVVYANPSLWMAAFLALGLRWMGPAVFILLKPSLLPFALVGIKTRAWWLGAGLLVAGSLPFLADTLIYPRVVLDAQGAGVLYSALSIPVMLIPTVAWMARTWPDRRYPPDPTRYSPTT